MLFLPLIFWVAVDRFAFAREKRSNTFGRKRNRKWHWNCFHPGKSACFTSDHSRTISVPVYWAPELFLLAHNTDERRWKITQSNASINLIGWRQHHAQWMDDETKFHPREPPHKQLDWDQTSGRGSQRQTCLRWSDYKKDPYDFPVWLVDNLNKWSD